MDKYSYNKDLTKVFLEGLFYRRASRVKYRIRSLFDEVHDDRKVPVIDGDVEGRPRVVGFCVVSPRVDRRPLVQKVSHDF